MFKKRKARFEQNNRKNLASEKYLLKFEQNNRKSLASIILKKIFAINN